MAQPIFAFDPKTVIRTFNGDKDDWREWEFTLRAFLLAKEMPTERLMPEKEEDIPRLPVPNADEDLDEQRTKERSVLRQLFGFLVLSESSVGTRSSATSSSTRWRRMTSTTLSPTSTSWRSN